MSSLCANHVPHQMAYYVPSDIDCHPIVTPQLRTASLCGRTDRRFLRPGSGLLVRASRTATWESPPPPNVHLGASSEARFAPIKDFCCQMPLTRANRLPAGTRIRDRGAVKKRLYVRTWRFCRRRRSPRIPGVTDIPRNSAAGTPLHERCRSWVRPGRGELLTSAHSCSVLLDVNGRLTGHGQRQATPHPPRKRSGACGVAVRAGRTVDSSLAVHV